MTTKAVMTSEHLLEAGSESLLDGMTSLDDSPTDRDLRNALREVASGTELVLKSILAAEHWALIFDDPKKASIKNFEAGDFKSVGPEAAVDRIIQVLDIPISGPHKKYLKRLRDSRNRLEHGGLLGHEKAVRAILGAAAHAIHELILKVEDAGMGTHFTSMPEHLIQKLLASSDFVKERWKEVQSKLPSDLTIVDCASCGQPAGAIDDGVKCYFCNAQSSAEEAADHHIAMNLGINSYRLMKDGEEYPLYTCMECDQEALVPSENDEGFECYSCGTSFDEGTVEFCDDCNRPHLPEPEDMTICKECFSARIDKF